MDKIKRVFFELQIEEILKKHQAHKLIYPSSHERYKNVSGYRESAVMVSLFYTNGVLNTLVIQRSPHGNHAGQIAFPGGAVEPEDSSLEDTAIREFREEVGAQIDSTISALTPIYIPVSNYRLTPYIGIIEDPNPSFSRQVSEVEKLISIPISEVMKMELVSKSVIVKKQKMNAKGYQYKDHFIWGASAMVMTEFQILCEIAFST